MPIDKKSKNKKEKKEESEYKPNRRISLSNIFGPKAITRLSKVKSGSEPNLPSHGGGSVGESSVQLSQLKGATAVGCQDLTEVGLTEGNLPL